MAIKTYPKGSTEKLSKNFRACEFDCRCSRCKETKIDEKLVEYLQQIRDHFGKPVNICGPYRCPEHNAEVANASKTSRHMKGMAADIKITGVEPAEIAKYAESIGVLGIGLYDTDKDGHFVHIDTRDYKRFWFGHAGAKRTTFGGAVEQAPATEDKPAETFTLTLRKLSKGSKGEDVKALQQLLIANGYNCGVTGPNKDGVDGSFGGSTQAAVIHYQTEHSLTGDGVVGPATMASLLGVK